MQVKRLIIAPTATNDLKEIYAYSLRQWGQSRSNRYLENIKDKIWLLIEQPLLGIERPEIFNDIRSVTIESHTLFYKVTTDTIQIIRVLHRRQDPQQHLK